MTTGSEQVQSLFHQPQPPTRQFLNRFLVPSARQVLEASFGLIADARVGGTPVRALVDTGATINLIRSDVYGRLTAAPALQYNLSLETADGRAVKVDGWVTTNLELGSIYDDIEALVVPELKDEVILGMRSLKEYECSMDFHCDNLWTGPNEEGSIVPLPYEPLRATSPGPSAVTDSQNPEADVTETLPQQPTYGPGELVEGWKDDEEDHFVQVISNGDEVDLQAQAERHLEEDVQKILSWLRPVWRGPREIDYRNSSDRTETCSPSPMQSWGRQT